MMFITYNAIQQSKPRCTMKCKFRNTKIMLMLYKTYVIVIKCITKVLVIFIIINKTNWIFFKYSDCKEILINNFKYFTPILYTLV